MFRKLVFVALLTVICAASWNCSKSDDPCAPVPAQDEEPAILQYLTSANIDAVKDPESGLYYQVIEPGSGSAPVASSRIYIKYKGTLLNGTQFDAVSDPSKTGWALRTLIPGWQIGIPKIKKGGKVKLIIPSSLAYGCNPSGSIPGNSILVFDVELVDFN